MEQNTRNVKVADDDFETALRRCSRGDVDFESAWSLFSGADRRSRILELFALASKIRDENLGRELALTAHVHMVTPCQLSSPCMYCSLSSSYPEVRDERSVLAPEDLARSVREAAGRGVQSIVLVGGTNLRGSDSSVRKTVQEVRKVTDVDLAINIGPSISQETMKWLKDEGVGTVYCSIETADRRAFAKAKPGDSLDARIGCMEMVEREGLKLGNVVMNGLGTTADLLKSILYLRRFRSMAYLYISTFHPVRGTPWGGRRPASVQVSLKALAIARLVFPKVHIGLAEVEVEDPGSASRLSSQLSAGGGNTLAALLVYKRRRIDNTEPIRRQASLLGFKISNSAA